MLATLLTIPFLFSPFLGASKFVANLSDPAGEDVVICEWRFKQVHHALYRPIVFGLLLKREASSRFPRRSYHKLDNKQVEFVYNEGKRFLALQIDDRLIDVFEFTQDGRIVKSVVSERFDLQRHGEDDYERLQKVLSEAMQSVPE